MEIKVKEPDTNRFMRLLIKSVFLFIIFWGIFFVILSIIAKQTITGIVIASLVSLLYYMYRNNRVVKVRLIKDESVVLNDGKRDIELKKEDISYVFKFVRFAFTERYLLAITVQNGSFLKFKRYLFFNDSRNNLINLFKKMKIDLKNIPWNTKE